MGSDQVAANRNSGVSIWGGMNESKHHSSLTEAQRLPVTYSNAMCAVGALHQLAFPPLGWPWEALVSLGPLNNITTFLKNQLHKEYWVIFICSKFYDFPGAAREAP